MCGIKGCKSKIFLFFPLLIELVNLNLEQAKKASTVLKHMNLNANISICYYLEGFILFLGHSHV